MQPDDNCYASNAPLFRRDEWNVDTIGGLLHHVVYYRVDGQHCDEQSTRRRRELLAPIDRMSCQPEARTLVFEQI